MTRTEINREFGIFTSQMSVLLEKLNEQYFLITEKYGEVKAELLLEGFWDSLKKGASKISQAANVAGKAVGQGVAAVTGAKTWLYNKGVQLGQQATTIISNLATKIEGYIKDAYNYVVTAPGKFMEKIKGMWTDLKSNLESLKNAAGDKYQEILTNITANITKKIVEPLKAKWEEYKKNYAASKEALKAKSGELKEMSDSFIKSGKEDLVAFGKALQKGAETAGFFVLGLIVLPFYAVFKGSEYLYGVGSAVVANIKQNAPEVWNSLQVTQEFKKGYAEGKNPTPAQPAQAQPTKESRILDFDSFMKKS